MKKCFFLFFLMLSCSTASLAQSLMGDVNGDGVRSVMDVSLLADYIMSGHGDFDIALGDMDGSGTISVSDISILVDIILGASYNDPDNPRFPLDDIGEADPATGL